jgi:predicted regulator of Ras-like GTPase activity (Roadblock/LC7/MglB family)
VTPVFKETLQSVIDRTEGATGALIMGVDGIAVEKVLTDEARESNLDVAAAEFTSLVRSAQRAGVDIGLGGVTEMVLGFDEVNLLLRLFNREYFVVLAVRKDGNLGRGRFELRKVELDLAREFTL